MRSSLYNHSVSVPALAYATLTTGATAGAIVDTGLYGGNFRDVLFVLTAGTVTNGTFTITVLESNDSGMADPTAVDAFRVQGTLPVFDSNTDDRVYAFGVQPTKRYVQATCTVVNGVAGGPVAAVAVLSGGRSAPPARA